MSWNPIILTIFNSDILELETLNQGSASHMMILDSSSRMSDFLNVRILEFHSMRLPHQPVHRGGKGPHEPEKGIGQYGFAK